MLLQFQAIVIVIIELSLCAIRAGAFAQISIGIVLVPYRLPHRPRFGLFAIQPVIGKGVRITFRIRHGAQIIALVIGVAGFAQNRVDFFGQAAQLIIFAQAGAAFGIGLAFYFYG